MRSLNELFHPVDISEGSEINKVTKNELEEFKSQRVISLETEKIDDENYKIKKNNLTEAGRKIFE